MNTPHAPLKPRPLLSLCFIACPLSHQPSQPGRSDTTFSGFKGDCSGSRIRCPRRLGGTTRALLFPTRQGKAGEHPRPPVACFTQGLGSLLFGRRFHVVRRGDAQNRERALQRLLERRDHREPALRLLHVVADDARSACTSCSSRGSRRSAPGSNRARGAAPARSAAPATTSGSWLIFLSIARSSGSIELRQLRVGHLLDPDERLPFSAAFFRISRTARGRTGNRRPGCRFDCFFTVSRSKSNCEFAASSSGRLNRHTSGPPLRSDRRARTPCPCAC